jgi:multiple sugar transport system permease protein
VKASRETRSGLLFASPWIIGFGVFLLYPVLASLYLSFTNFAILRTPRWVGAANYGELAHDEVFYTALKNTLLYVVVAVPVSSAVAIGLAMLLNSKVKGLAIYRTLFFLPALVPLVAMATLFLWVFNGDHGLLNESLRSVHVSPPDWIGDPHWAKWTLVLIAAWGCGRAMVIYLAGLQNVPISLYEAAEIDGAKFWAKTRCVTIPMISPVILFNVIIGMIGAIQLFAEPYVMFPGGQPARSTYYLTSYLYDSAFSYQRMGYGSAIGWVMFLITLVLTMVAIRLSDRHVHYETA